VTSLQTLSCFYDDEASPQGCRDLTSGYLFISDTISLNSCIPVTLNVVLIGCVWVVHEAGASTVILFRSSHQY